MRVQAKGEKLTRLDRAYTGAMVHLCAYTPAAVYRIGA